MPVISVIICTHNPREDYLRRVLAALQTQTLAKEQWELLLVDNASREPLAIKWDISWHPNARHLREEKTGLTHARLCGIAAAQGDLFVFVDDDNVLRPDYLQAALKISTAYPWLGAWGGSCLAEFEVQPTAELRPWLEGLVIEKLKNPLWAKLPRWSEAGPAGAGLVVRRQQAKHYRELVLNDPLRQALDRSGTQLGSGGDGDLGLCGFELGLGTGRFPELELTHLIPAQRVTVEYLAGIHEGFGYGGEILKAIHQPELLSKRSRLGRVGLGFKWLLLLVSGKPRVERRLRLAEQKGRLKAHQTLARSGHFPASSSRPSGH